MDFDHDEKSKVAEQVTLVIDTLSLISQKKVVATSVTKHIAHGHLRVVPDETLYRAPRHSQKPTRRVCKQCTALDGQISPNMSEGAR